MSFGRAGRVAAAVALLAARPSCSPPERAPRRGASLSRTRPSAAPAATRARAPPRPRRRRSTSSTSPRRPGSRASLLAGRPGKDHLLDSAGAGAAWLDYDRDGRLDLYLVNGWTIDGEQRRREGQERALPRRGPTARFEDVTDAAGVGRRGRVGRRASFVADYDDGRLARPARHQLRPEHPLPQPRQRPLRERRGEGRPRVARAGTPAPPSSTPTATATSTSSSPVHRRDARRGAPGEAARSSWRGSRWWPSAPSA